MISLDALYSPFVRRISPPLIAILVLLAALTPSRGVEVNWSDVRQRIDGFGASSAWTAQALSDSQADMFFSATKGIGLSLLRNRIAPDGTTLELVTMQKAQARGAKVWSTPWSPPAAWKDNLDVNNGGQLLTNRYADYANQLANYVANMKSAGVNLYAISVQNEPSFAATYESARWSAQQIHHFISDLHAALTGKGVSSTKILIAEDHMWRFTLTLDSMNDPNTAGKVGILAAHGYGNSVPSPVNSFGKPVWQTEVSTLGEMPFDASISDALPWAVNLHEYLTKAEVNAWHYWWLRTFLDNNAGLMDQYGNPAKRMYVLGNYSKFVRPDFHRIGTTNDGRVLVSAYKDPTSGKFAIAAINTNHVTVIETFQLKDFTPSFVTPWITSETLSLEQQTSVPITGSSFDYALPARSVVTFVGKIAPASPPEILIQPQSARAATGTNAAFSVFALSGPPLSYQWRVNGTNLARETNAALSLRNVQTADTGNYTVVVANSAGSITSDAAFLKVFAAGIVPGYLFRELYREIPGTTVSSLTNSSKYPFAPDQTDRVGAIESTGLGTNYGVRLSGFITAPASGNYTFYISSDDQAELYLSTDQSPANKARIAHNPAWNNSRDWVGTERRNATNPENRSAAIPLTAGQSYFVEVLHKQGTFGDNVAVTWQKPGDPTPSNGEAPISGEYLSYEDPALQPPRIGSHPQNQSALLGSTATFAVSVSSQSPLSYQWKFNGADIPGAVQVTLSLMNVQPAQAGVYTVAISNAHGSLVSGAATLSLVTAVNTSGFLQREIYRDVSGTFVSSLTNHSKFPNAPDQIDQVSSLESRNLGDFYGVRLSGFITTPTSGSYVFYISSDDQSELYLSTDQSPAKKARIAFNPSWNNSRDWVGTERRSAANPENRSGSIALMAGQSYYIEVLHKEGDQGDHVAVTWQKPGDAVPANGSAPIGGAYLSYTKFVPYLEPPAITIQPLSQNVVVGTSESFTVTATGGATLSYQWRFNGANISGATNTTLTVMNVRPVDAGDYTVLVSNSAGSVTSAAARLSVARLEQTITFDAIGARTFGDPPFSISASVKSGLPVRFDIIAGPATITGSTVTINGAGLVTVRASQNGDANFNAAPGVDQMFTVNRASQAIAFPEIGSRSFGMPPFAITATASSGLPVNLLIVSGPAALQGNQITATDPGMVVIRASQPGDANYLPATEVEQSFLVEKARQSIAFGPITNKTIIAPPLVIGATASSGLPVTFSIIDGPAWIATNTITVTNLGTVTVRATQLGNDQYNAALEVNQSFTVTKAAQTIAFASIPNTTFGVAPFTVSASASSRLPVNFSVISGPATVAGDSIFIIGAGEVVVRASQAGDAMYEACSDVEQSFTVAKASQIMAFGPLIDRTFGSGPFEINAQSSSGLAVTFNVISGPAMMSGGKATLTGVGTVIVRASQSGDANYNAAPDVEQSFKVLGAVATAITELNFSSQGEFSFVFTGESGRIYNLEVSNDMALWTVLDTRLNSNGKLQFRDFATAGFKQRFYRVIPKPD